MRFTSIILYRAGSCKIGPVIHCENDMTNQLNPR